MTLFVNPTQFGPGEDLARYPRDEAGDLDEGPRRRRGPRVRAGRGRDVSARPPDPGRGAGAGRAAVRRAAGPVTSPASPRWWRKLFHLTVPHVAVFGQKDYQQLAVIRRMVRDLDFGIEVIGMPIVREPDGLAMSSRNAYLGAEERAQATCLSRGLRAAERLFADGERAGRRPGGGGARADRGRAAGPHRLRRAARRRRRWARSTSRAARRCWPWRSSSARRASSTTPCSADPKSRASRIARESIGVAPHRIANELPASSRGPLPRPGSSRRVASRVAWTSQQRAHRRSRLQDISCRRRLPPSG